jgi:branched-chain amino acid transport system substrate-binding protein
VAKIQEVHPDTVITGNWSNDLLLLMKAAGDAGIKVRFGTTYLDQPGNIANAGEVALDSYIAHPFNVELADPATVKDYEAVTGHVPSFVEPGTVNGITLFTKALEAVDFGGGEIDANAIALALEKTSLETPVGTISVRVEDHQMIMPVVVSKVSKDVTYPVDGTDMGFKPVKVVPPEQAIYPVQDSCQMKRPS